MHHHFVSVFSSNFSLVVESVTSIQPTVESPRERIAHSVCVTGCVHRSVQDFTGVTLVVSIGVTQEHDVWNRETDDSVLVRVQPDGNVQVIGKGRDLVGATIAVGVFKNLDRVVGFSIRWCWIWVLAAAADPQSAA